MTFPARHLPIVDRIQEFGAQGLALSFISLAELYEGVFYSQNRVKARRAYERFFAVSNY